MYSFFQSYALSNDFDSQFETVDLSGMTLEAIFNNYRQVYLSLNYQVSQPQVIADLNVFRSLYRQSQTLLGDFISSAPNGTFAPLPSLPYNYVNYVRYMDSQLAGYSLAASNGSNITLSNNNVSTKDFLNYCLTSVNGFILPVQNVQSAISISQAFTQAQKNGYTRIGIISFENVGAIITTPLTSNMIATATNRGPEELLYLKTSLNPDYVTMLVLNGYLIAPTTNAFYPVGNGLYALSLKQLGYQFKLLDSRPDQYYNYDYILSQLSDTLTSQYNNIPASTMSIPLMRNIAFIQAYLTLPNTFLVQVQNASNIIVKIKNILNTDLVNQVVTGIQPTNLLVGAQGRQIDYLYSLRKGKFVLTSPRMYSNNYVQLSSQPSNDEGFLSPQRIPLEPLIKSSLYWKQYGMY